MPDQPSLEEQLAKAIAPAIKEQLDVLRAYIDAATKSVDARIREVERMVTALEMRAPIAGYIADEASRSGRH